MKKVITGHVQCRPAKNKGISNKKKQRPTAHVLVHPPHIYPLIHLSTLPLMKLLVFMNTCKSIFTDV